MVQDIFLVVRREKTTLFLCCKEDTTVRELKMMIEGITKKSPDDQQLSKEDQTFTDEAKLGNYGFTAETAKAQTPAIVNLVFKGEDENFEQVKNIDYSSPPELPDVMKSQEGAQSSDGS